MKQSKFSEERIAYILRQAEGATPAVEVCRQNNPAQRAPGEQTFYRWKKKYGGTGHPLGGMPELRRLRQIEEENSKLKQLVADLSLDKAMLQELVTKKL